MEPIVYNKFKEIIRRTPIRVEESVDFDYIEEIRVSSDELNKLELLRTQLIDAGFICEYELCDDDKEECIILSSENEEEKRWAEFQREFEIDERRRRGMDDNYIEISDDDDI